MKTTLALFILVFTLISGLAWTVDSKPGSTFSTSTQPSFRVPLTGILTVGTGGIYNTLTAAINDLNSNGVALGGVIFDCTGNFIENPPAITATGAADSPIIFRNTGEQHAKLYATGTTGTQDFGICLYGGDYFTFDGIDIYIYSGYLVEFGYFLRSASGNGCNNNTIQNCVVQLTQQNTDTKAVYVQNSQTSAASANSNNHFFNIAISYSVNGYYFAGSTTTARDMNNVVGTLPGGTSSVNWMSGGSANSNAIFMTGQENFILTNTTVNNVLSNTIGYGIQVSSNCVSTEISNCSILTVTGGSQALGISLGSGYANIFNNTVNNITATSGNAMGLYISSSNGTNNIYNNKITLVSTNTAAAVSYGMAISSGLVNNIYNNFIANIKGTINTGTPAVQGISIQAGTTHNIFHNTVVLSVIPTGAAFYSAAIFMSPIPAVNLINNILVNLSTTGAAGTGRAAAIWRFGTGLANFALSTDNNLYYAGTPSLNNLLFYDGINSIQTLDAYKAYIYPREVHSVFENPPLINQTTDLHLTPGAVTKSESGGIPITSPFVINTDFDNDTRSADYPDIGADEGAFTANDLTGPSFTMQRLANTSSLVNRTLNNVTISDFSGIDVTSVFAPRIYFKKSSDANVFGTNNSSFNGWKWTQTTQSGSPYSFLINYSLLQSMPVVGEVIQYFVTAQDLATVPNPGAIPGGGFTASTVSAITSAPSSPASYLILYQLSGIKTVGVAGDFPTLTQAAVYFNNAEIVGHTEFQLLDTNYSTSEVFPLSLNQIPGLSAVNDLVIKPAPGITGITISGASAGGIFNFAGVDYVTIDGSAFGTSSRDLTLANTVNSGSNVIFNGDASNDILKNCILTATCNVANSAVVYVNTTAPGIGNSVLNCSIHDGTTKPYIAVYISGSFAGPFTISGCDVFNTIYYGIWADNIASNGVVISNNTVHDFTSTGIMLQKGTNTICNGNQIYMTGPASSAIITGINIHNSPNAKVTKNYIHDLRGGTSTTIYGINSTDPGSVISVDIINNEIVLENGLAGTSGTVCGIVWNASVNVSANIYFNSVLIGGTGVTGGSNSYALGILTASGNLKIKNNVLANIRSNGTGLGKHCAIGFSNTAFTTLEIDNNDYIATGTGGLLGLWGAVIQPTLADWQLVTTQDLISLNVDPLYTYGTNYLMPQMSSPIARAGVPILGVTDDFLGVLRNVTQPTMGAFEIFIPVGLPNPAVAVSPLNNELNVPRGTILRWADGGGNPTSYLIYFGTDNPPTNILNGINRVTHTTYVPGGPLNWGTVYYWQVVPTNANGNALNCPIWRFTTRPAHSPRIPINVNIVHHGSYTSLTWDPVPDATSYIIWGSTDSDAPFNTWTMISEVTTTNHDDLVYCLMPRYFYRVTSRIAVSTE